MTLKALATQLECQGVDPGYVRRFDWEKWILGSMDHWETVSRTEDLVKIRSLVLYLLQEYLGVENSAEVAQLKDELKGTEEDLKETENERNQYQTDLETAESNLEQVKHELETLKGTLRSLDIS